MSSIFPGFPVCSGNPAVKTVKYSAIHEACRLTLVAGRFKNVNGDAAVQNWRQTLRNAGCVHGGLPAARAGELAAAY